MKDEYEKHGSEFKNEADVEEEFDEEGLKIEDVEKKHFEEDDDE